MEPEDYENGVKVTTGEPNTGLAWSAISANVPSMQFTNSHTVYPSTQDMIDRLEKIEKRLAILNPDQELMDKYPALQEAYEHYKLIEALVKDPKK